MSNLKMPNLQNVQFQNVYFSKFPTRDTHLKEIHDEQARTNGRHSFGAALSAPFGHPIACSDFKTPNFKMFQNVKFSKRPFSKCPLIKCQFFMFQILTNDYSELSFKKVHASPHSSDKLYSKLGTENSKCSSETLRTIMHEV